MNRFPISPTSDGGKREGGREKREDILSVSVPPSASASGGRRAQRAQKFLTGAAAAASDAADAGGRTNNGRRFDKYSALPRSDRFSFVSGGQRTN